MEDKNPITILTKEGEQAFKKLSEIQNSIADGLLELDKIKNSIDEEVSKRKELEQEAVDTVITSSQELLATAYENYAKLEQMNKLVGETYNSVMKLAQSVERAIRVYEEKSKSLEESHKKSSKEQSAMKARLIQHSRELEARKAGLEVFNQSLLKKAADIESKVDSLKALK